MKDHYEYLAQALRYKLAPSVHDCLADTENWDMSKESNYITLPLEASVKTFYEKDLLAFKVRGSFKRLDKNGYDCVESLFSTRQIALAADKHALIDYMFDQMKEKFKRDLAEEEMRKLIRGN